MEQTGRFVAKKRNVSPPYSKIRGGLGQRLSKEACEDDFYSGVYSLDSGKPTFGTFQPGQPQNKWSSTADPFSPYQNDSGKTQQVPLKDRSTTGEKNDNLQTDNAFPDYALAGEMGSSQSKSYSLFKEDKEGGRKVQLISSSRNKDNRPPAKVPIVIDKNNLPPIPSNNNDIQKKPLSDGTGYSQAYDIGPPRVRLGDYTQPADATGPDWARNDEYCEPYVADELMQEGERRGNQSNQSSPDRKVNAESGKPAKMNGSPTHAAGTSADGYDHTSTWTSQASEMSCGSTYEEPWDSKIKQKELEERLIRAKSEDVSNHGNMPSNPGDQRRYSNDRMAARHRPAPTDMYEDAWDTAEKQRLLQERLSAATRYAPPKTPTTPDSLDLPATGLESRLEMTRIHNKSPTPASPTGRSLKSPCSDTYEEAWDLNQRAKALSYLRSNSQPEPPPSPAPRSPTPKSPAGTTGPPPKSPTGPTGSASSSPSKKPASSPCNIGERINPIVPLSMQNWYHGRISRSHAEHMLIVCKEGSYLVRESESDRGQYSLSIKSSIMNIHLRICRRLNGKFVLGENSADFNSIPEMIDYYTQHPVPLKGAEHLTLLYPVEEH